MVQYVEGLQPECRGEVLVDREYTRDLSIELVVGDAAEGISANVSVRSISGASRRRKRQRTPGSDLSEGGRAAVGLFRPALYQRIGQGDSGRVRRRAGRSIWEAAFLISRRDSGRWSCSKVHMEESYTSRPEEAFHRSHGGFGLVTRPQRQTPSRGRQGVP